RGCCTFSQASQPVATPAVPMLLFYHSEIYTSFTRASISRQATAACSANDGRPFFALFRSFMRHLQAITRTGPTHWLRFVKPRSEAVLPHARSRREPPAAKRHHRGHRRPG